MATPIQIHLRATWIGMIQGLEGEIRRVGIILRGYEVSRSHLNFQPYLESIPLWLLRRGWGGPLAVPHIQGPRSLANSWGVANLCTVHHIWFLLNLYVERLKRGRHFREAKHMRDRSDGLLLFRGQYRPGRWSGVAASLRHTLIMDGAVLTPTLNARN